MAVVGEITKSDLGGGFAREHRLGHVVCGEKSWEYRIATKKKMGLKVGRETLDDRGKIPLSFFGIKKC